MIKYVFFDVGSTLVDETECENYRIDEAIKGSGVDKDKFIEEYISLAKENKDAFNLLMKKYGLIKPEWPSFKEKKIEGVERVLEHFGKRFKLGVIANQPLGTEARLEKMGLRKYFEVVASSAEVGHEKPSFEIFNYALDNAGVTAEESVMVGDRIENDILPAQKLGFKTIWIRRSYGRFGNPALLPEMPDFIADDILDLCDLDLSVFD